VIRRHSGSVRIAILGKPLPTDWSTHIREVPHVAATLSRIYADCAADPACATSPLVARDPEHLRERGLRVFLDDPEGPLDIACVAALPPIHYSPAPPDWVDD
jgi:hypothetical protein